MSIQVTIQVSQDFFANVSVDDLRDSKRGIDVLSLAGYRGFETNEGEHAEAIISQTIALARGWDEIV